MIDPRALIQEAMGLDYSTLTKRQAAELMEGLQAYRDEYNAYTDEIMDSQKPDDLRIVTRIDGGQKLSRFSSIEALAEWITKGCGK